MVQSYNEPTTTFLHGGSGHRLNDGPDAKLSFVGWCLMLVFGRAHRGSTSGFLKL